MVFADLGLDAFLDMFVFIAILSAGTLVLGVFPGLALRLIDFAKTLVG